MSKKQTFRSGPFSHREMNCEVKEYIPAPKFDYIVSFKGKFRSTSLNPLEVANDKMRQYYLSDEMSRLKKKFIYFRNLLKAGLTYENYVEFSNLIIGFDEVELEREYADCSLSNVILKVSPTKPGVMSLKLPSTFSDKTLMRKNNLVYVIVKMDKLALPNLYEGKVVEVLQGEIEIQFSYHFGTIVSRFSSLLFDVYFKPNTYVHFCMKEASKNIGKTFRREVLFCRANQILETPFRQFDYLEFFNSKVAANPQQAIAVRNIVNRTSSPLPYLLHGPPGTGKTSTIVEAVLQILKMHPRANILCCAQSNVACDNIALKLMEFDFTFHRLYSQSVEWESIPNELKTHYNYETIPKSVRVIICTNITSKRVIKENWPVDFLFIDEASQSLEFESLVPIQTVANVTRPGYLILCGDPMQLGPVVKSKLAIKHNFETSLMERLMEFPKYKSGDNQLKIKLTQNFRSHEVLLTIPNKLFYEKQLLSLGNDVVNKFIDWSGLPKKGFPLFVHGVCGKEEQHEKTCSYYNSLEVNLVMHYVHALIGEVELENIGIITPYNSQVVKIKSRLKKMKYDKIMVGPPEVYQGNEREVIILSTVRSSFNKSQAAKHIGFLRNPKRFNVAVTRAKCLLIVIGNPFVLSADKHWNSLLQYCLSNSAYTGIKLQGLKSHDKHDVVPLMKELRITF